MSVTALDNLFEDTVSAFQAHGDHLTGYIDTQELYDSFWCRVRALGFSFSVRDSRHFAAKGKDGTTAIYWQHETKRETSIPYFGSPFCIEGNSVSHCSQGPKYYKERKEVQCAQLSDHVNPKKKRLHILSTKKLGCPANLKVRWVKYYPDYSISNPSSWREKAKVVEKLQRALQATPESVRSVKRFYITISKERIHSHSRESSHLTQETHPLIIREIYRLVEAGITSVRDVKLLLDQYIANKFETEGKPSRINSAFYPSGQKIYAHMHKAIFNVKKTLIDQEALSHQVDAWKAECPSDSFLFREYKEEEDYDMSIDDAPGTNNSILFCHQAEWQKRLLGRYGRICLLDATYKTTKYALPLFFLTAKTNSGYIVVGTFIIQSESALLIAEALRVFSSWNPEWQPDFWMTDFSEAEINAIEQVFPSAKVYLCAFHREQAWLRWLRKSGNLSNPHNSEEVLDLWRKVANSPTEEDYESNIRLWSESSVSKCNIKAVNYFQSQWVPESHRWVTAFHQQEYIACVSTNNGVESQNKVLKYTHLRYNSDKTLTGMLKIVINTFLPTSYRNYCIKNSQVKVYNSQIPKYLHDRPSTFIKHMMDRIEKARADYASSDITDLGQGTFAVRSKTEDSRVYVVEFECGSCSCYDFSKWRFPCKHMCAIFEFFPSWGFDKLNADYKENPYITLDSSCGYGTTNSADLPVIHPDMPSSSNCTETIANIDNNADNSSCKRVQQLLREELKDFIDKSYLCTDSNLLEEALRAVKESKSRLTSNLDTLHGLPLEVPPANSSAAGTTRTSKSKQMYQALPLRCNKSKGSSKYSGRVGKKATMWKNASQMAVELVDTSDDDNM